MKHKMLMLGIVVSLLTMSCSRDNDEAGRFGNLPNDEVLKWNEVAYEAFGGVAYQHSLMASRINAMVHLAMHDALNAVYPKYATYAYKEKQPNADPVAAAVTAAHDVLVHEIPARQGFIDSALQESLSAVTDGDAKTAGVGLGKLVAQAIIANRAGDGADANPVVPVPVSAVPGVYQAVPPFDFYFAPFWQNLKLFGLQKKDQFRSMPPPALNSAEYTTAFNEVKEFGRINSTTRTEEQKFYAQFWYEFSEAGWNRVARVTASKKKLNLYDAARLFALVDMAMADSYTAGWDSKLYYNLWRPYTAIRNAENDGNNLTGKDQLWEPLLPTPPIQDYPSTHSVLGKAAATVLGHLLGDTTPFTMPSPTAVPAGATCSFTSFSQAAAENADSRVRAGIHFRFACDAGLEMGKNIGDWLVSNHLKPLK